MAWWVTGLPWPMLDAGEQEEEGGCGKEERKEGKPWGIYRVRGREKELCAVRERWGERKGMR